MTNVFDVTKTESRIIQIIADQAMIDVGGLNGDTLLADLALDSLMMVEVVFALEEEFDVAIPFNANGGAGQMDLTSVASIARAIDHLRA